MLSFSEPSSTVDKRLTLAVQRLMALRVDGEIARLSVPSLYPSGASATVEITTNGNTCFVSDIGRGYMEAEFQGADKFYAASAHNAAKRFGVGFDGFSVFASWASIDRVESAICLVANASTQAAAVAIFSAEREQDRRAQEEIYDKIAGIFRLQSVNKSMGLRGRDAEWNAHNVVAMPNEKLAIFEFVKESQNSIANKFMMFSDLSRVENGISLNSVVRRLDSIGKKGSMLADVSNVIELSANDEEFRRHARGA